MIAILFSFQFYASPFLFYYKTHSVKFKLRHFPTLDPKQTQIIPKSGCLFHECSVLSFRQLAFPLFIASYDDHVVVSEQGRTVFLFWECVKEQQGEFWKFCLLIFFSEATIRAVNFASAVAFIGLNLEPVECAGG
jgi:hypothetical protein